MFGSEAGEEGLKEVIDRMKKRLIEHDEKHSKGVKDLKNKDALIAKLKQELREVMENMENTINEQKSKEIDEMIEKHIKKEFEAFAEWKKKVLIDRNIENESK